LIILGDTCPVTDVVDEWDLGIREGDAIYGSSVIGELPTLSLSMELAGGGDNGDGDVEPTGSRTTVIGNTSAALLRAS
jgi:hypothetical protein